MTTYTFTTAQLSELIKQSIHLYDEYQEQHGYAAYSANNTVLIDIIAGLDTERYLYLQGEIEKPSQVIPPQEVYLAWKLEDTW